MSDTPSSRRSTGEDVFFTAVLLVLDAVVAVVVLLTALGATDFNMFEPNPHADVTPVFAYVAGFAGLVLLSAAGLYRGGYRVSVAAQVMVGAAALACCAAGFSGQFTL
ncbi:DUF6234 family protein [Streptomyces sp. NPDC048304]|uniref:DUF6234 family protein n=1 Tax=Streptomyces sp. NPDC048304 TaxID=3154820 RepID=UPI0033C84633